jgi:hypothetical protein
MSTEIAEAKAVEAAVKEASEDFETPAEVDVHEDRTKETRTPGFTRMRTDWHGHDAPLISMILQTAEDRVLTNFADAYQIINDIYDIVREPEVNDDGEVLTDRYGFPVWAKTVSGRYIEDYSRLGSKERDEFLFQINTRLFEWEQKAADAWGEAMFAKAQWEERFAVEFSDTSQGGRKTDEAMTQRARAGSRDERYFAIFESLYSRKADALVRSLERLGQRLKDSLYS